MQMPPLRRLPMRTLLRDGRWALWVAVVSLEGPSGQQRPFGDVTRIHDVVHVTTIGSEGGLEAEVGRNARSVLCTRCGVPYALKIQPSKIYSTEQVGQNKFLRAGGK